MPPRPLPDSELFYLKQKFRELVDWAFDGNLSLAARILDMPFSTVQQYYQKGPRRLSASVVKKMNSVVECNWTEAASRLWRYYAADNDETECYVFLSCVRWRVRRVVESLMGSNLHWGIDESEVHWAIDDSEIERIILQAAIDAIKALSVPPGTKNTMRILHGICHFWESILCLPGSRIRSEAILRIRLPS